MSANGSSESSCRSEVRPTNNTCFQKELSITASVISMTVGIFSNSLALFILLKSYSSIRTKSRASFLLFASSLVITDLLGHLINGSLVLFVYSAEKKWENFDPYQIICTIFGACMVFFGLSPLFLGSAMAVERCIGVTRPIFHSTVLASHHMKRLLGVIWLLAALVAALPVMLSRPYKIHVTILSTRATDESPSFSLLTIRMATWNQILDPWVYILLRKAVLRKIFVLLHSCCGLKFYTLNWWQRSMLHSSVESSSSSGAPSDCRCLGKTPVHNVVIKSIT